MTPSISCPRCGSPEIVSRNFARKICSVIGTFAGAAHSVAESLARPQRIPTLSSVTGPFDVPIGGFSGAVMKALLGGAAGCAAGAMVGSAIDDNILNNYKCESCGHTFSNRHLDVDRPWPIPGISDFPGQDAYDFVRS